MFEPKFHACATSACAVGNANLDISDQATQAYVRALDQQVLKGIGTGATVGSLVNPLGAGGQVLFWLGAAVSTGLVAISNSPYETARDEALKAASEKGGESFFKDVLGHTPGAAARAAALIELSGGWDAFVSRLKTDLLGVTSDDSKK